MRTGYNELGFSASFEQRLFNYSLKCRLKNKEYVIRDFLYIFYLNIICNMIVYVVDL